MLKEIIQKSTGLDPSNFVNDWESNERYLHGTATRRHLERVTLEVYNPRDDVLVTRWDIDVVYASVGRGPLG